MTIKTKRRISLSVLIGFLGTITGLTAFAFIKPKKHTNFIVSSSQAFSSLNYVKESSGSTVYASMVEGLIAPSPMGVNEDKSDSLSTIVGAPKLSILGIKKDSRGFDGLEKTPSSIYKITDMPQFTYGMADQVLFSSDGDDPSSLGQTWRFHIRDANWANGDRVSAEDFVQTIKYAANLKNGSTLIRTFRDAVPLKGMKDLLEEQKKYYENNHSYKANLSDYDSYSKVFSGNGGIWAASDPEDPASSYYAHDNANFKSSSYLYYQLEDGEYSTSFYNLLGNPLFLPTNERFINSIGGIDKFGLSKSSILSNGPFVIEYYDPDYEVTMTRSGSYWDRKRTLSNRWTYRIVPDISTSLQLFREGKLSQINIPVDFLKTFREDPKLNRYITRGGTASSTTYLKWNMSKKEGYGPVHKKIVEDPNLRRAIASAINRKDIIDIKGMGNTTPSGDVFSAKLSTFKDENNNSFEDYLYRQDYITPNTHKNLGSMLQFNPKESRKFRKHEYINGIKIDKYYNDKEARASLAEFIKTNPKYENENIHIKMIYNTADEFSALMLRQQINNAFGGKIILDLKPLPPAVFDGDISNNKGFDIAVSYQSPDYQTDAWTFLRMFASPPDPTLKSTSTINATGAWTFYDGFKWLKENQNARLKEVFEGWDSKPWTPESEKTLEALLKEIHDSSKASTFGSYLTTNKKWTQSQKMNFYTKLEVLIRDQAPVVPLYHATTSWFARRIIGATALAGFPVQYKFAYNANDVPDSIYSLPGVEAFSKEN